MVETCQISSNKESLWKLLHILGNALGLRKITRGTYSKFNDLWFNLMICHLLAGDRRKNIVLIMLCDHWAVTICLSQVKTCTGNLQAAVASWHQAQNRWIITFYPQTLHWSEVLLKFVFTGAPPGEDPQQWCSILKCQNKFKTIILSHSTEQNV